MMPRLLTTLFLFLLFTLHVLIFSLGRWPDTFITIEFEEHPFVYKTLLYSFAIGMSCLHQPITKRFGIKKTLIFGLCSNFLGICCIMLHRYLHTPFIIYLATVFLGSASISVLNSVFTFIVLEHPKKTLLAITALFAFGNAGLMLAPYVLDLMTQHPLETQVFSLLLALLVLFMVGVYRFFQEPPYPPSLHHLRSGTLLWKEMHPRLMLYIAAAFLFSMTESTFSDWSSHFVRGLFNTHEAIHIVAFFWLSIIFWQLFLLVPLYYFEQRMFYLLLSLVVASLLFLPSQTDLLSIKIGLFVGALGCAALFPIILSFMEMEIIFVSLVDEQAHFLPLIETAISFIMAGYMLGNAVSDFWYAFTVNESYASHFYLAEIFVVTMAALIYYLNKTRVSLLPRA